MKKLNPDTRAMPVNLDGEPYLSEYIHFEAVPAAIDMVLPANCPMLKKAKADL